MQETTPHTDADAPPPVPDAFVEGAPRGEPEAEPSESLVVDLDGFEGPLDVLLTLARNQKVDLTRISILALAEQYLEFINRAHRLELDLAADYLVMAAWLAYLKSKLLLPPPDEEEGPSGAEMAARLAFQLQRLEAMRNASQAIFARKARRSPVSTRYAGRRSCCKNKRVSGNSLRTSQIIFGPAPQNPSSVLGTKTPAYHGHRDRAEAT